MVDPPRKGLDNKSIDNILKIKPNRVVYISCNPATLVRDLAKFEENYLIEEIRLVDMFPHTILSGMGCRVNNKYKLWNFVSKEGKIWKI